MDKAVLDKKIAEIDAMSPEERAYNFFGDIQMDWEIEVLELYLERGVSVNYRTPSGDSALLEAVTQSNLNYVTYFLSKGAEVNVTDRHTYTPLRYAALYGDYEITKLLIDAGADIEYIDEDEYSILASALKRANTQPQNSIVVKQLIEAGVDLSKMVHYTTPLYHACKIGSYEIAKMFIDAGVDVNGVDESGVAPLSGAANYPELVELLLSHGANPSYKNPYNATALTNVAKSGNIESMKRLINAGGDVNDPAVAPIIFESVKWGKTEMVEFLIEQGAELSRTNEDGKTVEYFITDRTGEKIVKLIKENK